MPPVSVIEENAVSAEHSIDPDSISSSAVAVTRALQDAGFDAWLVGGCVRDLLLGLSPKDYDVATDATPVEIRAIFRRSRIIGRRFQIVHVRMGRELIEVTTYRKPPNSGSSSSRSDNGRILDDNEWGDLHSDCLRRDFTVNALYYDPGSDEGYDQVDGLVDLEDRIIRMIGNPKVRFSEDPVRILRAIRFMAKLGFTLEEQTDIALIASKHLLTGVPAARLYDEVLKLFHHGNGETTGQLMSQYGVFPLLFPMLADDLDKPFELPELICNGLRNTDLRIRANKPVIPAFLFAVCLWQPTKSKIEQLCAEGCPVIPAIHQAAESVFAHVCETVAIPRRVWSIVQEIWELEYRLRDRRPKFIGKILENRRFRAAYDFLELRSRSGEAGADAELVKWWETIQNVDEAEKQKMIESLRGQSSRKPGGNRRRRRPKNHVE